MSPGSGGNSSVFTTSQSSSNLASPHNSSDFSIFQLPDHPFVGVAYLSSMGQINLARFIYDFEPHFISVRSEPISYPHFSLSAQDLSTPLYTYYQVNATTIAEVTFDLNSGFWSSRPTYIRVDLLA